MAVKFGIIGCGMIAGFHARSIKEIEGAELVGCVSQPAESASQFAAEHDCVAYDDLSDMLEDSNIDAVTICTPSGAHMEPAVAAAAAGKHVIVEKPLEVTLERCDRIIEECDQNQVRLSTIFQSRFHESSQLLKQAVDEGRFGRLSLGNAYVKWFRTQDYYDSGQWRGTWELDGGGALMNQAIHNVDLLLWVMGPAKQISAQVATLSHERIEVEDTAVATIEFSNGALGTIEAATSAFPGSPKRLEVYGSQGCAAIEDERICDWRFLAEKPQDKQIRSKFSAADSESGASDPAAIDYTGHKKQFQDVIRSIENGTPLLIDGQEARKSVELVLAIYKASQTRQTVQLPLK